MSTSEEHGTNPGVFSDESDAGIFTENGPSCEGEDFSMDRVASSANKPPLPESQIAAPQTKARAEEPPASKGDAGDDESELGINAEDLRDELQFVKWPLTERDRQTKVAKETMGHIVFLLIFALVTILPLQQSASFYSQHQTSMETLISSIEAYPGDAYGVTVKSKRVGEVRSLQDMFDWLHGPAAAVFYSQNWFSGRPLTLQKLDYVAGNNQIVASLTIRQKRVTSSSCEVTSRFLEANAVDTCAGLYSPEAEATETQIPASVTDEKLQAAFKYNATFASFDGVIGEYNAGGFGMDLSTTVSSAREQLQLLQGLGWVDANTRAVVLETVTYNHVLNLFSTIRIVFETPPSGIIEPSVQIRSTKLYRYLSTTDFVVLGFEISLLCLLVFDATEKYIFYSRYDTNPFLDVWNVVDAAAYVLFIAIMGTRLQAVKAMAESGFVPGTLAALDLSRAIKLWDDADALLASLALVLWVRSLKFMKESPWMGLAINTIQHAFSALLAVTVIAIILLIAFAHCAYLAFGSQLVQFSSFRSSMLECFQALFRDLDYNELYAAGTASGPIFYVTFHIFMSMIVMHLFIAVVVESFLSIRNAAAIRTWTFPPLFYFVTDVKKWYAEYKFNKAKAKRIAEKRHARELRAARGEDIEGEWDEELDGPRGVVAMDEAAQRESQNPQDNEHNLQQTDAKAMYVMVQARLDEVERSIDQKLMALDSFIAKTVSPLASVMEGLVRQQVDRAAAAAIESTMSARQGPSSGGGVFGAQANSAARRVLAENKQQKKDQ